MFDVYVHDAVIRRVIEDPAHDLLIMECELPVDEWSDDLTAGRLVFEDAYGYQVHEGPFVGCPEILGMKLVGTESRWHILRIDTNAGYRELRCMNLRVESSDADP